VFFFDPTMIILIPGILLAIYAQYKVHSAFAKCSKIPSRRGITGREAARIVLESAGMEAHFGEDAGKGVGISAIEGSLSDHYDPRSRQLRLSEPVYKSTSLAAIGIAAHEAGHAIQHHQGYAPMAARSILVPFATFGPFASMILLIAGIIMAHPLLIKIGVVVFSLYVAFALVTLPVEFNASSRALKLIEANGIVSADEIPQVRQVLNAAAMTYVAGAVMAILSLLRLLIIANRSD